MTTKKPLADALQATIGKYILEEDFNAAKISISLWKGDVSLYGVRLNVKAINRDFGWEETPDLVNINKDGSSRDSTLPPVKESSFHSKKVHSAKKPHPESSITSPKQHDSFNNRQDRAYGSRYNEAIDQSTETNFSRNETTQSSSGMSYTVPRAYINENWAINVNRTGNSTDEKPHMSFLESLFSSGDTFSNGGFRMPKNVQLHNGYIDKIEIEIPWSALATKHVAVRIIGVRLTFGPVSKRNTTVQSQNVTSTSQKYHTGEPQSKRPSNTSWYGKFPDNGNQQHRHNSMSTSGGSMNSSIVSSTNKVNTHSQSGSNSNITDNIEAKGSTSRQTIGKMILRSIPYSAHFQREFQKNRRAREEEYVIKRRREVMQTLDQNRRNLKRLRKHLFPMRNTYQSFLDDQMEYEEEKINNDGDGETVKGTHKIPKISNQTFGEKIKRRLVENLHLNISSVHIQYTNAYLKRSRRNSSESHQTDNEDDIFVGGIVLDSLTVRTTDEHGRETKREREKPNLNQDSFFFKAFKILGFGIYVEKGSETLHKETVKDPNPTKPNNEAHSINCVEDLDSLDQSSTFRFSNERLNLGHYVNYIVNPLTFEAAYRKSDKVVDNNFNNGLENTNEPQHLIFSKLEHLSISVSKTQLGILNDILQNILPLADNMIKPLYPEYRPPFALTAFTAKEWWKYAVRSVLRMNKKSLWLDFLYAFRKRKKYIMLYKRYYALNHSLSLGSSQISYVPLSSSEDLERRKLEDDLSVSLEGIISWRAIAETEFKTEYKSGNNKRTSLNDNAKKWTLPTFLGGEDKTNLHDSLKSVDQEDLVISHNKMNILESQLEGFDEIRLALESVQVEFEFTLGFAVLVLAGDDQSPVAKFRGESIEIKTSRLAGGGSTFNFSLNNFYVEDSMTLEAVFPSIFSSIHEEESTSSLSSRGKSIVPAVSIQFSKKNDLDIECLVNIAKFELVYSPPFLKGLNTFFSFDHDSESTRGNVSLHLFQRTFNIISNRLRFSFNNIWRQKLKFGTKWKLRGNLHSPIIVFADGDCTNPEAKVVSLILGNHTWSSCSKKRSYDAPAWTKVPSPTMIDSWNIDIDGLTLLTSAAGSSDWLDHSLMLQSSIEDETKSMIEPFSVSMELGIIKNSVMHSPVPDFNIYFDFKAPSMVSTFTPKDLETTVSILMKWSKWGNVKKRQSSTSHSPIDIGSFLEIGNSRSSFPSIESINSIQTLSIEDPSQFIVKGYFMLATVSTISFSIKMMEGSSINAYILSLTFKSIHKKNALSKMQFAVESFWLYDRADVSNEPKLLVHSPVSPELSSILLDTNPSQTSNILRYLKKSSNKDTKQSDRLLEISFSSLSDQQTFDFSSNSISTIDDTTFNLKVKIRKIALHHYSRSLRKLNDIWTDICTNISPLLQDKRNFISGMEEDVSKSDSVSTASSLPDPITASWLLRIFPKMSFVENVPSQSHLLSNMDVKVSLHVESLDISLHFDDAKPILDIWAHISMNSMQFKLNQQFDNNVNVELSIDSISANTVKFEGELPKHETFCHGDPSVKFITISFARSSSRSTKHLDPCKAVTTVDLAPLNFLYSKTVAALLESSHDDITFREIMSKCLSSTTLLAQDFMWLQRVEQSIRIKIPKPSLRITSDRESDVLLVSATSISINYNHQPYASGGDGELKIKALNFFLDITESLLQQPIKISVSLFLSPIDDTGNSQVMKVDAYFSDILLLINRNQFISLLSILNYNLGTFGSYDQSFNEENDNELANFLLDSKPTMLSNERQITKKIQIQFKLPLTTIAFCNQSDIESITLKLRAEKLKVLVQCIPCQNFRNIDGKIRHFGIEFTDDSHQSMIRNVFSQIYPEGTDEDANIISCHFEEVKSVSAKFSLNFGAFQVLLTPQILEEFVVFFNPLTLLIGANDGLPMFHVPRKIDFSFSTSICKIIMLESSFTNKISSPWGLAIQGILKFECDLSYDEIENMFNNNTELHITDTEVYRAHGSDMLHRIEISEPFNATFVYCKESQNTDIKVVFLSSIDSVISTNDIFLLFNIYSSVEHVIKKVTLAINEASNEQINSNIVELQRLTPQKSHRGKIHMNLILPSVTMVITNDIQPQDQALFRFSIEHLFCDIDIESYPVSCHIRQSILTEYLDSQLNHWKVFSSWCELTINMTREQRVFKNYCEKTVIEAKIDLQPLSVSVSKELLHKIQSFSDITKFVVKHLSQKRTSGDASSDLCLRSVQHSKTNSSHAIRNDTGVIISFDWGEGSSKECQSGVTEYFSFSLPASRGAGSKRVYAQDYMNARYLTIYIHDGCLSTDSNNSFIIDSIDENVNKKRAYKFGRGKVIIVEFLYVENVLLMICRSRILLHNLTNIDFKVNVGISEADNNPTLFQESTSQQQTHSVLQKLSLPIPIHDLSPFDTSNDVSLFIFFATQSNATEGIGQLEIPSLSKLQKLIDEKKEYSESHLRFGTEENPIGIQVTRIIKHDSDILFVDILLQPLVVILNNLPTPVCLRSHPHAMIQNKESNRCEQTICPGSFIELFSLCNELKIELCLFHGKKAPDNFWNPKGAKEIILNLQKNSAVYPRTNMTVNEVDVQFSEKTEVNGGKSNRYFAEEISLCSMSGTRIFSLDASTLLFDYTKKLEVHCSCKGVFTRSTTVKDDEANISIFPAFQEDLNFDINLRGFNQISQTTMTSIISVQNIPLSNCISDSENIKWEDGSNSGYWIYKLQDNNMPNFDRIKVISSYAFTNVLGFSINLVEKKSMISWGQIHHGETTYLPLALNSHFTFMIQWCEDETTFHADFESKNKAGNFSLPLKTASFNVDGASITLHCTLYEEKAVVVYHIIEVNRKQKATLDPPSKKSSAFNKFFLEVLWKPAIFMRQILVTIDSENSSSYNTRNVQALIFDGVQIAFSQASLDYLNTQFHFKMTINDMKFEEHLPDGSTLVLISKNSSKTPFLLLRFLGERGPNPPYLRLENLEVNILDDHSNALVFCLDKNLKLANVFDQLCHVLESTLGLKDKKFTGPLFAMMTTVLYLKNFRFSSFNVIVEAKGKYDVNADIRPLYLDKKFVEKLFRKHRSDFNVSEFSSSSECRVSLSSLLKIILLMYRWRFRKFQLNHNGSDSKLLFTFDMDELITFFQEQEYLNSSVSKEMEENYNQGVLMDFKEMLDLKSEENKPTSSNVNNSDEKKSRSQKGSGFFFGFGRGR